MQKLLDDALSDFAGQAVKTVASSRTDAGVHALANTCHVDILRVAGPGRKVRAWWV